ncbi:MAG: methyltransferase domain-containing protein [Actinomycetota bacterium]|nr:methyltransferase domain-containing protein [Actinomycetota bacterium]
MNPAGPVPEPPADTYTHGHAEPVLRSHRWRTAENSAGYLLDHLRSGMDLLDVGCGPGTLTVDLARRTAPGRTVGIDVAAEAVAAARDHVAATGVPVELVVGDLRDVDLAPRSFDVVHAHQVLQHLQDPIGALRALATLARPGGGIVAVRDADYPAMVWAPAEERLDRWRDAYLAVTQVNGAAADAGRHLLRWAQDAGLHDVTYTTSTWTFATPQDRAWWAGLWAERTVASTFAEQAVAYGVATPDELAEMADGWRAWAADTGATFTVVHGELVALT